MIPYGSPEERTYLCPKCHICDTCKWAYETEHYIGCNNPSPDRSKWVESKHIYEPCGIWEAKEVVALVEGKEKVKTPQEIEALKRNWKSDPCWDIEDTEGFEEYKDELKRYRIEQQQEWKARRYNQLLLKSDALGIMGNIKLTNHIESLENRIKSLEERLYSLENISDAERTKRRM